MSYTAIWTEATEFASIYMEISAVFMKNVLYHVV